MYGAAAMGLWIIWGALSEAWSNLELKNGVRTKGTVLEIIESGARAKSYSARVEFKTDDGKVHRFTYGISTAAQTGKGDTIDVVYLPDNPAVAARVDYDISLVGPIIEIIFGALFLLPLAIFSRIDPSATPAVMINQATQPLKWIGVAIVGGAGLGMFLWGTVTSINRALLLNSGVRAEGTLVRLESTPKGNAIGIVEFTGEDGTKHLFKTTSSPTDAEGPGTKYPVVYSRAHPSNAAVTTFWHFWIGPLVLTLMGAFFSWMGWLVYLFVIKDSA
ncbi:MAG: DUF3592 domain-containing protein [Betaproteobacteria bacterium]|nr:DUF3592 domain-containing protein [Betaproteobacteria bacterium]